MRKLRKTAEKWYVLFANEQLCYNLEQLEEVTKVHVFAILVLSHELVLHSYTVP